MLQLHWSLWLSQTLKETVQIFLSISLLPLYPFIFTFLGVIWIYRYFIQKVVKWQDPKICRVLTGMDACIAAHDTYSPIAILVPVYILSSKVDVTQAINLFNEKIFKPKHNGGECLYPELKQRIVRKYGYNFWRSVDDFKIEDHIRFLDEKEPDKLYTREQELGEAVLQLIKLPFNPELSPWQMIFVKNLTDKNDSSVKSAIIFRFHHCLCDGYSIMKFTQSLATHPWKDYAGNLNREREPKYLQKLYTSINLFFTMPYHVLNMIRFSKDDNEWADRAVAEYCNKSIFKDAKLIPLRVIKSVKDHHSVSFSSVVISLTAEAVLKTMARENITVETFTIALPFPMEGHPPGKLTNHWSAAKIPINICKDNSTKTLQNIEHEFRKLRYSLAPLASFYCAKLTGLLPIPLIPPSDSLMSGTCVLTNVPGPSHEVDLLGYPVRHGLVGVNSPKGYAVAVGCGSYNGNVMILAGGESSIFKEDEDAEYFAMAHNDALDTLRADAEQNLIVK